MTLRIEFKWIDAGRSVDRLSSATMAELVIVATGVVLTSHVDRQNHSYADEITVPLHPVAGWLTSWWWAIFHEYGEWAVEEDAEYLQRHDMAFAGAGFVYPNVLLQPTGRFMEIRSRHAARRHSPIEFLRKSTTQVPLDQAEAEFSKLITAVVERLRLDGLSGSDVEEDWEAIGALKPEEMAFCEAAGRFGLDPFDARQEDAAAIERLGVAAEPSLRDDLFGLVSPCHAEALLEGVRAARDRAEAERSGSAWTSLAAGPPPSTASALPWEAGFAFARWARERMNLDGEPLSFQGDQAVATVDLEVGADRLSGVVSSTSPTCALRPGGLRTSRRFTQARAVGDYLMRATPGPSLLTSMRTDRQSRTRSFAAEFLAPAEGIRARLAGPRGRRIVDADLIDAIADEYGVSSSVVAHKIQNHDLGSVAT